jgi:hypothetical protein
LLNTLHEGTRDLGGARISRIALRVGSWNRKHSHKLLCNRHLTNTGVGVENDKGHCFAVNDCVMDQECMGWLPGKLGDSVTRGCESREKRNDHMSHKHAHTCEQHTPSFRYVFYLRSRARNPNAFVLSRIRALFVFAALDSERRSLYYNIIHSIRNQVLCNTDEI